MNSGPEYTQVEQPFIDQLVSMGWKYTTGDLDPSSVTSRESFREVIIEDDLRKALVSINVNDQGQPWLDDGRVSQAVSALQRIGVHKLMEANEAATNLLFKGTAVEGIAGWEGGRFRTVRYIDWAKPEKNTFRVINQFKVECPGGRVNKHIVPDLVLFVNGIPLVVVECKSPYLSAPIEEAIDQLQRYSNQRTWVDDDEGNERLFHTNQFMVVTSFDQALVGTISARAVHYREWKDTSPAPMAEVAEALGTAHLSSQDKLVAGMLRPANLLDIVRHFVLFQVEDGMTTKLVCRYQQFRAVQLAMERLLTGKTKAENGEHDRRGGIVWHTQGSGKSLTMVFLVRKMRSDPMLRRFKVVLVTDRKFLQKQLAETAELTGEVVKVARNTAKVQQLLAEKGPGLVFAMIQKYQERDLDSDEQITGEDEAIADTAADVGEFPILNEDESILVIVDEAHRSHGSALHANLLKALPNCARMGFTGTPIIMGARQRTHEIFGDFIDRYTIRQSEEDRSTVPILYEGRTTEGAVADGRDLDEVFEDMFAERTPEELEAIKNKYATKGHVMEAPALIAAKARDILRHYTDNILPNGFKAQVVAVSRRATILYYEAFLEARDELVAELEAFQRGEVVHVKETPEEGRKRIDFLKRAGQHLDTLKALEFAPVISGSNNDDPAWKAWTERAKSDAHTARFKKPFFHDDPEKRDPLAFLIVKSMLLTGFDAPVEQVMYLDRHIQQAELLQAIARVNRTCGEKKTAGFVVDYYGVARHLKEALAAYSNEDIEGALQSLKDEIPKLRDRHRRVLSFFAEWGIGEISNREACVELLRDERLRAEFQVKLKQFLATLDLVLPRPEGLPYVRDARLLGEIQIRARNRYRGGERPIGMEVGEKVRALIDEHIISLGIDPKIPPISILDADFDDHIEKHRSGKARASEMEHALRYHISTRLDEDPEHYQKLSERLDTILTEFQDRWDDLVEALKQFVSEVQAGRQKDDTGLDPEIEAPFLGILIQAVAGDGEVAEEDLRRLCELTVQLVNHIRKELRIVGFWRRTQAQNQLRSWVVQMLDDHDILPFDRLPHVAERIVELAKVIHGKLTR